MGWYLQPSHLAPLTPHPNPLTPPHHLQLGADRPRRPAESHHAQHAAPHVRQCGGEGVVGGEVGEEGGRLRHGGSRGAGTQGRRGSRGRGTKAVGAYADDHGCVAWRAYAACLADARRWVPLLCLCLSGNVCSCRSGTHASISHPNPPAPRCPIVAPNPIDPPPGFGVVWAGIYSPPPCRTCQCTTPGISLSRTSAITASKLSGCSGARGGTAPRRKPGCGGVGE